MATGRGGGAGAGAGGALDQISERVEAHLEAALLKKAFQTIRLADTQRATPDREKQESRSIENSVQPETGSCFAQEAPSFIAGHQGAASLGHRKAGGFSPVEDLAEIDRECDLLKIC